MAAVGFRSAVAMWVQLASVAEEMVTLRVAGASVTLGVSLEAGFPREFRHAPVTPAWVVATLTYR